MTEPEAMQRVGPYSLVRRLGVGSFSEVFEAHGPTGQRLALKVARNRVTPSIEHLMAQQNEIELLRKVDHPSLVKLRDFGQLEDGTLYVAMEFVEGERLDEFLARAGRLDALEVVRFARRIADALDHLHRFGILHLDLKPANIIITSPLDLDLKILDFGLASHRETWRPASSGISGTPLYMAPECANGDPNLAHSTGVDLYALGVIMYELVAGHVPFPQTSLAEMFAAKNKGAIPPLLTISPMISAELSEVIHRLLHPEPTVRFSSASALSALLGRLYYSTLGRPPTSKAPGDTGNMDEAMRDLNDAPFVGRTAELARLERSFGEVETGAAASILVMGDAGLGKSRFVHEFLRLHDSPDVLIALGRCRELGHAVPYSCLREALAQLLQAIIDAPGERGRRLRESAAKCLEAEADLLLALVPEFAVLRPSRKERLPRLRLFGAAEVAAAVAHVINEVSRCVPLVLVLEDLHWADEGTLQVLQDLIRSNPRGVLILGTCRPASGLLSGAGMDVLHLTPLDAHDNDILLRELARCDDPSALAILKRVIPVLSAGNPLFNVQVIRNLEIEGYIARTTGGKLTLSSRLSDDFVPPTSVSTVLRRTIGQLDSSIVEILGFAALMGRRVQIADLKALLTSSPDVISAALRDGASAQLCQVTSETCTFVHDVVREAFEETVTAHEKPGYHAAIARRLERTGAPAGDIAHHREGAGLMLEAAQAYFEAAKEAELLHDPLGARNYLTHVQDLLADASPDDARDVLLLQSAHELARVGCMLGNTDQVLGYLDRCKQLIDPRRDGERRALSSSFARVWYVRGDFPRAMEHSREALAEIDNSSSLRLYQALPFNILGRAFCASGNFTHAIAYLERGCSIAQEAGEHTEQCHSEGLLAVAKAYSGRYHEARHHAQTSAELATRLQDPIRILGSYYYHALMAEASFEWDIGLDYSTRLLAYAEQQKLGGLYLYVGTMIAGRHQFHVGRLSRACLLLSNSLNLGRLLKISMLTSFAYGWLGDAYFVAGNLKSARDCYVRAIELAPETQQPHERGIGLAGLAACDARAGGSTDDVRRLFEEASTLLNGASALTTLAHALQRYEEAMDEVGDDTLRDVVKLKHQALKQRLGVPVVDWWPRIPQELAHLVRGSDESALADTPSRRSIWVRNSALSKHVAGRSTLHMTTESVPTDLEFDHPGPQSPSDPHSQPPHGTRLPAPSFLLESLSTINGFVPDFVSSPG